MKFEKTENKWKEAEYGPFKSIYYATFILSTLIG